MSTVQSGGSLPTLLELYPRLELARELPGGTVYVALIPDTSKLMPKASSYAIVVGSIPTRDGIDTGTIGDITPDPLCVSSANHITAVRAGALHIATFPLPIMERLTLRAVFTPRLEVHPPRVAG